MGVIVSEGATTAAAVGANPAAVAMISLEKAMDSSKAVLSAKKVRARERAKKIFGFMVSRGRRPKSVRWICRVHSRFGKEKGAGGSAENETSAKEPKPQCRKS
jgi:hypothetical protein